MKKIKYIIITLISLVVLYMLYSITLKTNEIKEQKKSLSKMPKFSFKTLDGNTFNYSDLDTDEPTLIIYFSTTCIHCENQIENLKNEYSLLKNTKILLVSVEEKNIVSDFINKYDLINFEPEITVALSGYQYFNNNFGHWPKPSLFLYNKNKELLLVNKGEVKVESLLKFLKE